MITLEIVNSAIKEMPFFNFDNSWILSLFKKRPTNTSMKLSKEVQIQLEDFVKAYQLDQLSNQIYGKSFKKKSLKKLRQFNPESIKVKRIIYNDGKSTYIPTQKIKVGLNRIYYISPQLSIYIEFINAKTKIGYGRKI